MPQSHINIKATTTEGLGFVGRKEGICAQAQVSTGFVNWQQFILQEGGTMNQVYSIEEAQ